MNPNKSNDCSAKKAEKTEKIPSSGYFLFDQLLLQIKSQLPEFSYTMHDAGIDTIYELGPHGSHTLRIEIIKKRTDEDILVDRWTTTATGTEHLEIKGFTLIKGRTVILLNEQEEAEMTAALEALLPEPSTYTLSTHGPDEDDNVNWIEA